jgi:hypothetical protein
MAELTLTANAALRKQFIEMDVVTQMEPVLYFLGFPTQQMDGSSFKYYTDKTSAYDDITSGKMGEPLEMGELDELTRIEVSPIDYEVGTTSVFGYSLKYSDRMVKETDFVDEVTRAYNRAAYGMGRKMNSIFLTRFKSYASAPSATLNGVTWGSSTGNQNPPADVRAMKKAMNQEGWPYVLRKLLVESTNYFEFEDYMIERFNLQSWDGMSNGVEIQDVESNLSHGEYIGYDTNNVPMTIMKYTDPQYSTIQAQINQDPAKAQELPSALINVDTYKEQEYPKMNVIEIWSEFEAAMKEPEGAMYGASGI